MEKIENVSNKYADIYVANDHLIFPSVLSLNSSILDENCCSASLNLGFCNNQSAPMAVPNALCKSP